MRRSIHALTFVACLVPLASIASAQDAQPDAGAPNPTTTVTPTVTATAIPTPTVTATATATPTPTPTQPAAIDQEPLRLGRMIELEADRARTRRYGANAMEIVLGAGAVIASSLALTLDTSGDPTLQAAVDVLAITGMVSGGLVIVEGLISMFVESPMERLFDRYAPIAIDTTLTPADRLRRGEMMLEAMANAEHSGRTTNGVSSIVLGALEAGFAIFFGADNDFWGTSTVSTDRMIITTAFAIGAAASIGDGIAKLVWERGPAEVAWEHWRASHGSVTVQTSKVHFRPYFGPTVGGATAGFSLRF